MKNVVVFPGSFDPVTIGHVDIIKKASEIFDRVIVLVMKNVQKKGLFSYEQRKILIESAIEDIDNASVQISTGTLVDFMNEHSLEIIVKGLRNSEDFIYERDMAYINKKLSGNIKTLFLLTDSDEIMISSSVVRELIAYGMSLKGFVPKKVEDKIWEIVDEQSV